MQFNVEWLKKWVAIDLDAEQLADKLTASGLEVDDIRPVAGEFSDVVVAEIEDCQPHPNADKLSLCTVNDGGESACRSSAARPTPGPAFACRWPGSVRRSARISRSSGPNCAVSNLSACCVRPRSWGFPMTTPA